MQIVVDEPKCRANIVKPGLDPADAARFKWTSARVMETRFDRDVDWEARLKAYLRKASGLG